MTEINVLSLIKQQIFMARLLILLAADLIFSNALLSLVRMAVTPKEPLLFGNFFLSLSVLSSY